MRPKLTTGLLVAPSKHLQLSQGYHTSNLILVIHCTISDFTVKAAPLISSRGPLFLTQSSYIKQEDKKRRDFTLGRGFFISAAFLSTVNETELDETGDDAASVENVSEEEEEDLEKSEMKILL